MQPHPCTTTPWDSTANTFVGGGLYKEYHNNQRLITNDDATIGMVLPRPDKDDDMTC